MNMPHVPPRFHGQQQQGMHGSSKANQRPKDNLARGGGPRAGKMANKGSSSLFTQPLSQNTQDVSTQPFSQGGMALTQGMSQVNETSLIICFEVSLMLLYSWRNRECHRLCRVSELYRNLDYHN